MSENSFPVSVFIDYQDEAYPFKYEGSLHAQTMAGGVPANERVAEAWLKTKLTDQPDELIRQQVAATMAQLDVSQAEATRVVDKEKHLNCFKRACVRCGGPQSQPRANCPDHTVIGLHYEGRQLKAALKEAANVAVSAGKIGARGWGKTNKGLLGFVAEHIFVVEDTLFLYRNGKPVLEPDDVVQRFVHTFRGAGIQYEEFVENVDLHFHVISDWEFSDREWRLIWLTGQQQGAGASRSQGFGKYVVTKWERKV
jgi:hypothetical protein